jgi:superfamily II DNA or RNA helicase
MITITKLNESFAHVECTPNEAKDLESHFSFFAQNYQFSPKYVNKKWNGKIYLFSAKTGKILYGLIPKVVEYAEWKGYDVDLSSLIHTSSDTAEAGRFIASLSCSLPPRDYQLEAFHYGVSEGRVSFISPTGSGKSLIIWLLSEFYKRNMVLLIVPSVSLVHQMHGDIVQYGGSPSDIHLIYSGQAKTAQVPIVISTWQSLANLETEFFEQFGTVIVDEVHTAEAAILRRIISACTKANHRFGFTGSLHETPTHKLVIEGLFGPVYTVRETHELISDEILAKINIEAMVLKHTPRSFKSYQEELDFICQCSKRNHFLANLAASRSGNTLLLFNYVERHGQILFDLITGMGRTPLFIHGGVDGDIRDEMRKTFEDRTGVIGVGSFGTCQQGINIVNLHNLIIGSPVKSSVRLKQSIGRGTRRDEDTKLACSVYDIADDFRSGRLSQDNRTLSHFRGRLLVYAKERHPVRFHSLKMT